MKSIRSITIVLLLLLTSVAQCQTANIITPREFDNIEINGVKFIDIKNTLGEQNAVGSLFGAAIKIEKDDDPIYGGAILSIDFYYDGFDFSFYEKELSSFDITNNKSNITIQGVTVTIGDNISDLGRNVIFNNDNDGSKSILYQYCNGCNDYIYIDFDQVTKKITEIGYIDQT